LFLAYWLRRATRRVTEHVRAGEDLTSWYLRERQTPFVALQRLRVVPNDETDAKGQLIRLIMTRRSKMQPHVPGRHSAGISLRDGLISFVVILLAFAAFDDITTDNSTHLTVEYTALVLCAVWFVFVAARLIRLGRRTLGMLSLVALLAALWAQRGIGPGITPGRWPEYLAMIGVFFWFLALAAILAVFGWRGVPRPAISQR
jgi:hypothetical protein